MPTTQPTLLDQFRGTLWGAALGTVLGRYAEDWLAAGHTQPIGWKIGGALCALPAEVYPLELVAAFDRGATPLIGGQVGTTHEDISSFELTDASSVFRLGMTLPIGLFYHQEPNKLKPSLEQLLEQQLQTAEDSSLGAALAVNLAIAHILNRLHPPTQAIALLDPCQKAVSSVSPSITASLTQVERLLAQGAGLADAIDELTAAPEWEAAIALGFYCHLSTPEAFNLTLLRALRSPTNIQLTAAITGALAGAQNGWTGIPALWRDSQEPAIQRCADQLLATWAGADSALDGEIEVAIAAPGVFGRS
jgi:ADP-ribosylglycohydrolase